MLPFSSERYEQLRDHSLLIRLVSLRDLGPYTCQAYNGLGKAASWTVTVFANGPVPANNDLNADREFLKFVRVAPPVNTRWGVRPVQQQLTTLRPTTFIPFTTTTTTTTTTTSTERTINNIGQPRVPPNYLG